MAFAIQNLNVDILNHTANLVAVDQSSQPQLKVVSVQFPFNPPHAEVQEKDQAIAAAKAILQQALNEI
jgi:hypothetical protein